MFDDFKNLDDYKSISGKNLAYLQLFLLFFSGIRLAKSTHCDLEFASLNGIRILVNLSFFDGF